MRIVHAMPEIDSKCPSDAKARKRQKIPALQDHKGTHHNKLSDREVIALLVDQLRTGEYDESISARTGIPTTTVRNWLEGVCRRRCLMAALRIHRESLKPR